MQRIPLISTLTSWVGWFLGFGSSAEAVADKIPADKDAGPNVKAPSPPKPKPALPAAVGEAKAEKSAESAASAAPRSPKDTLPGQRVQTPTTPAAVSPTRADAKTEKPKAAVTKAADAKAEEPSPADAPADVSTPSPADNKTSKLPAPELSAQEKKLYYSLIEASVPFFPEGVVMSYDLQVIASAVRAVAGSTDFTAEAPTWVFGDDGFDLASWADLARGLLEVDQGLVSARRHASKLRKRVRENEFWKRYFARAIAAIRNVVSGQK